MTNTIRSAIHRVFFPILCATALLAGGCSSGGGGGDVAPTSTLSGTVAVGKPLAGSPVFLKDAAGVVKSTFADAAGKFSIDVSGLTPPFILRSQDYALYSYASGAGVTNLTPYTTLVTGIAANDDPQNLYDAPQNLSTDPVMQAVRDLLNLALQQLGVSNTVDLLHTPFDADGSGLDALFEAVRIQPQADGSLAFVNAFTDSVIAQATVSGGTLTVTDPIDAGEAGTLPSGSITMKKYFAYVDLDGVGPIPPEGPAMVDLSVDDQGRIAGMMTFVEGDTGDMISFPAWGTTSGNSVTVNADIIMCSDTDPQGTGTVVLSGTIDPATGNLDGTIKQTLSVGDTCDGLSADPDGGYTFAFTADDVTSSTPASIAGNYHAYATPNGNYTEQGPVPMVIQQTGSAVDVSMTIIDGDTGQQEMLSGAGRVYGSYSIMRFPVIICNDTCLADGTCPDPEYATFFGKFAGGNASGWYGDGVPPGDYCKYDPNDQLPVPQTTDAQGSWRAVPAP